MSSQAWAIQTHGQHWVQDTEQRLYTCLKVVFSLHPLRCNNHWYEVMPARGHIATSQSVINLQNLEAFENNL